MSVTTSLVKSRKPSRELILYFNAMLDYMHLLVFLLLIHEIVVL